MCRIINSLSLSLLASYSELSPYQCAQILRKYLHAMGFLSDFVTTFSFIASFQTLKNKCKKIIIYLNCKLTPQPHYRKFECISVIDKNQYSQRQVQCEKVLSVRETNKMR